MEDAAHAASLMRERQETIFLDTTAARLCPAFAGRLTGQIQQTCGSAPR